jgi:hypothetical protein
MSYFDSKEEVIKLELTPHGKYLLSKGKLKPAYYAFFDDEILYDSRYFFISESQNETQTRILDDTPVLKPQVNFSNVEERVTNNLQLILNNNSNIKESQRQNSTEKKYALCLPLGKSSYNSENYPAWDLTFLEGKISSYVSYIDNRNSTSGTLSPFLRIPQVTVNDCVFDIKITKNDPLNDEKYYQVTDAYTDDKEVTYYFNMKEDGFIIDISELNVDDLKHNFDIEVFIEEEKTLVGTNTKVKDWKQLMFPKQLVQIKNGILLDTPENERAQYLTIDSDFAEHYINLLIDEQIELTPKQAAKFNIYDVDTSYKAPYGEDC